MTKLSIPLSELAESRGRSFGHRSGEINALITWPTISPCRGLPIVIAASRTFPSRGETPVCAKEHN